MPDKKMMEMPSKRWRSSIDILLFILPTGLSPWRLPEMDRSRGMHFGSFKDGLMKQRNSYICSQKVATAILLDKLTCPDPYPRMIKGVKIPPSGHKPFCTYLEIRGAECSANC